MKAAILIALSLLSLVSGLPQSAPASFFSNNYTGFKSFVQGFMNGYQGTQYTLPDDCLGPDSAVKLDQELAAAFYYFLRLDLNNMFPQLVMFFNDINTEIQNCGINQVGKSFDYDIKTKGAWNILGDIFYHFYDLEASLVDIFERLITEDWQGAGKSTGQFFAYFIPPAPLNQLKSVTGSFLMSLIDGLENDPENPSACGSDLKALGSSFSSLVDHMKNLKQPTTPLELVELLQEMEVVLTNYDSYEKNCDFSSLENKIEGLFSAEGWNLAVQNYLKNGHAIKVDYAAIAQCSKDVNDCGKAFGDAIRLILDWSL